MAIDLTGIINENEFYTHHYLSAILENDLKEVFGKWETLKREQEIRPPYDQLKSLAREYFRLCEQQSKTRILEEKYQAEGEFLSKLLGALGYALNAQSRELDDGRLIPVAGEVSKQSGPPELWVIHAFNPNGDELDPLEIMVSDCHYGIRQSDEIDREEEKHLFDIAFEEVISRQVFGLSEPPRWIILYNLDQILLIDRTKWNQKRFLRFDLREILGRRETTTFKAVAALLHRESVCPEDGLCLLDNLDENSHKHAFAVSEDLKYALRQSIELLGNEAVYYLREVLKEKIYGRELAEQLTIECLRYMYRLLFMFYIEARPELGYAPMDSEQYRKGYSLESLRELEMVPLTTEESRNGTYIHESIQLLFDLIYIGYPRRVEDTQLSIEGKPDYHIFRITPLNSHLFDPNRTALLNRVKFRNFILQEVIQRMSLTRPASRRKRRGRISYTQLGINQLGAVYEALLSYRGFFAETDLYEVKKAGERHSELETAYFVKAEDLEKYTDKEKVYNSDGTLVSYHRGYFIYRLAGRDREKSASYYTPEVLTRCLVKYALKELLKDKTADEILSLTVCEPAMGSAAFLNEAVNQLSEAYLQRKQKELVQDIPHDEYIQEKQKVKMYIADNNVFGVDLNPVAVELAEVSLWLNTIYEGAYVPWFGLQLACGNSLIGARRQVFDSPLLKRETRADPLWLDEVPKRIPLGEKRPVKSVYHFLLPDKGMTNYTDRIIKSLAEDEIKTIKEWRKEFTKPFKKSDIVQLEKLSKAVDRLWESHVKDLRSIRQRTSDPLQVFGQPMPSGGLSQTVTKYKDRVFSQELLSQDVRSSSACRRLKLVMDYWCALWFWPIEKADLLPTQEEYLFELSLILEGNVYSSEPGVGEQLSMFPDTRPKQMSLDLVERLGSVCIDELCQKFERLQIVQELALKYRFLHWELEFADLFSERGGFDLVLGNPPWIKVEWKEGGVLGDAEPLYILRKLSASDLNELRDNTINRLDLISIYLSNYEESEATQTFLNAEQNYEVLKRMKANIYKCFLPLSWYINNQSGITGFLHPDGVYDDPRGGALREKLYPKLRAHFLFQNQLKLFPDIDNQKNFFSINIYCNHDRGRIDFHHIANLFSPKTVDLCFKHDGNGFVSGIKNDDNNWNLNGHLRRIIQITEKELELFIKIYGDDRTNFLQATLPAIHSDQMISVLRKFANVRTRLCDLKGEYFSTPSTCWNEVNSQKDGTIERKTVFPEKANSLVLSGPHYFVGLPLAKTPRAICNTNRSYDSIDLAMIPFDYLPRTNFTPDCDLYEFERRIPRVTWKEKNEKKPKPVGDFYRLIYRAMIGPAAERTLIGAICPPKITHTNATRSYAFSSNVLNKGICFAALTSSILYEFIVKSTGRSNLQRMLDDFPLLYDTKFDLSLMIRVLILNCLTIYYQDLWQQCWNPQFIHDRWTKKDSRLTNTFFEGLNPKLDRNMSLRTDFERHQALVELDVLSAMALGLNLDELKTIFRVQFSVLRQYEQDTWYDSQGRIVFTCNKGLSDTGFSRLEWNDIKDMTSGIVERKVTDDTLPGGPRERTIVYQAPFDRCDRQKDYEAAWAEFERRFGTTKH